MDVFTALADPTRRAIVELLADGGQLSSSAIAGQFPVSAPAISQHLKVLREANLVEMEKQAQWRIYRVNPKAMLELEDGPATCGSAGTGSWMHWTTFCGLSRPKTSRRQTKIS